MYVTGKEVAGVNVFKKYERADSITEYGRSFDKINYNRLSDPDTMQKFADAVLDIDENPEIQIGFEVMDNNNGAGLGEDIEDIKVGMTVKVLNYLSKRTYTLWGQALWGVDKWGYDIANVTATDVRVVKIDYTPESVKIVVSSKPPFVKRTVNELRRRMDLMATANNPVAPT